ncbi:MAG: DUF2851 family protein [Bacteroidales bacterium]|nr:DUF2851 family protein [Bacteroidales bacterium]
MKEEFIYYLWENRLLSKDLMTVDGESVDVISVGNRNYDSGPDFLDARIRIGNTLWVGHVEIHVNASDWFRHGHQHDCAYKNVVLHVVYCNDTERLDIPTVEVKGKFDEDIYERYSGFMRFRRWIPCEKSIAGIQQFTWLSWLERVVVERLEVEVKDVFSSLAMNRYDWEETLYQRVMRYCGLKVNNDAFERLAKILPLRVLRKHIDNAIQVEAMIFGCAGFLEQEFTEAYPVLLQREFKILKSKFNLAVMPRSCWKFMRLRPPNFPTVRLAQIASMVCICDNLLSKLLSVDNLDSMRNLFNVEVNEYWDTHFLFEKPSKERKKSFGATATDVLIINAVIPVLFSYGIYHDNQELKNRSLSFLNDMAPEDNVIIRRFGKLGIGACNAQQTQALLHMYNNYCRRRKCLCCRVFNAIKTVG